MLILAVVMGVEWEVDSQRSKSHSHDAKTNTFVNHFVFPQACTATNAAAVFGFHIMHVNCKVLHDVWCEFLQSVSAESTQTSCI